jgi:hypothetical protein
MKHLVQSYFVPSINFVPSGTIINNRFNVVIYE